MLKEPLQFGNPEGGRLSGNSGLSGRYILKLMEYAPIGMALTDPAGHVLEFNDSFPRITGYAADELLGLDYRTLDMHCTGLEEELCRAAMQAKGYYGPYLRQFTRKDGQVVSLLLHSVQATENDQTFGIWLVVEDITERMQAAIKDEQERLRLHTILKMASDGIHILDSDGVLVEANDAFFKMLGYDESVIGKMRIADLNARESKEVAYARINELITGHGNMLFEAGYRRSDGVILELEVNAAGIEIAGKDYVYGAFRDITGRKQAAERTENEHVRLRTLLATIPDLVWLKDADGVYLACNPEFERFFGAPEADIVGKTDYDFTDLQTADSFRQKDRDTMAAGKPLVNEEWITYASDNHWALLETIKAPMYDAAGKLIGVLGVGRDITQRKQAEKAILRLNRELEQRVIERTAELTAANEELKTFARVMQAAKVEAERANAAKSHFLSSASHDLRQPLQALRLFIDMLSADLQGSQFQKKIDLAAKVLTSAETILHSLFDVARIQSGAFIPEPTEIGIVDLFGKFATEFTSLAQAKDLVFRTRPLPLSVQSDPLMLERIMRNLLANAVRYTERGGILLACRRRKQSVVIEVRDTGPGIAPEHHQAIWDEFYQIGNFGRDSSLGLGLGLSIVAKLAERLGHRVELYSRPSIGTAFRIVIPTTDQS